MTLDSFLHSGALKIETELFPDLREDLNKSSEPKICIMVHSPPHCFGILGRDKEPRVKKKFHDTEP